MPRSDAQRKLKKVKHKIGKITDAEIAEEAGVSLGSVRGYRKKHGIAPARTRRASRAEPKKAKAVARGKNEKAAPQTKNERNTRGKDRKPRRSKVGALRHLIGTIPDSDLARQAGVTVEAVRMYRRRHSIESHVTPPSGANRPRRRRSSLDPFFDMLGTVPDSEIASLAGVTGENVRAFRRRHGIDATWKGARPRKALAKVVPQATTARIQAPTPKSSALMGFLITLKDQGDHVVVAADISSAAQIAVAAGSSEVIAIRTLGPYIG